MRRTFVLFTALIVPLVGCRGNREKEVIGSWISSQGMKLTVAEDKTYKTDSGPIKASGTWHMEGNDFVFNPGTVNGQAVSQIKSRLEKNLSRIAEARRPLVEKIVRDIDRPNYATLSSDGKTLATDATKDENESPWTPLTKQ